ncbi:type I-F CRISPR-associated protein Csy3 [Candidatus Halobeggiatoa sp. HSG11]|nr:type I-F CRISPR-associated protein Csy3 [Candidatus Halobeggiatoa sp. HSG11]
MAIKLPSVNAITRTISPSHGLFYSFDSMDKKTDNKPVRLQEVSLVGTLGSLKEGEKAKKDSDANKEQTVSSNIQTVDTCFLPPEHDSYCLKFNLKITSLLDDVISNNPDALGIFKEFIKRYKTEVGGKLLAYRYLTNLVNGKFLWRNKYAENRQITLQIGEKKHEFNIDLGFGFDDKFKKSQDQKAFDGFVEQFANALFDKDNAVVIYVEASGKIGYGQEIYPSQEFVNDDKETKSKVLFDVSSYGKRVAAFHSQKIGNAIRTIDTWYAENATHAIPVDPFGPDKKNQKLHRTGTSIKDNSVYSMLNRLLDEKKGIEGNSGAGHYLMACFIRGGVYSGKGKDK